MKTMNLIEFIEKEFKNIEYQLIIKRTNKGIITIYRNENKFILQIFFKKTYKVKIEFFNNNINFILSTLKNEFNFEKIILEN